MIMSKEEVKNCWEFFDCKVKKDCPAYQTGSGKECWLLASNFCPRIRKGEHKNCGECPWYKKINADPISQSY